MRIMDKEDVYIDIMIADAQRSEECGDWTARMGGQDGMDRHGAW